MLDYAKALQRLLAHAMPLPSESCSLNNAVGRVLAADIASPMALPSFDHAAMDGYALCASEPLAAGSEHSVHGSRAAGDGLRQSKGVAAEIMTGARLPGGLNTVIAVERTELLTSRVDGSPARIRLLDSLAAGYNVRHIGADVAMGAIAVTAGVQIVSSHVMLLAALGIDRMAVVRKPRIAVVCTGKELQSDPARPLTDGHIHNSNGPYLVAALVSAGAYVQSCETVPDEATGYTLAIRRAIDAGADIVISTGAVSMGRHDFVPDALRGLGAERLFHKVAIRPGKPLLCARMTDGPLIIALPGTPMAVAVGLRFFVVPVLRAMAGQGSEPAWCAVLDIAQQPKAGIRHFLYARLHLDAEGKLHAVVANRQQPFRIQPFTEADAWVVVPEDAGDGAIGTLVDVVGMVPGTSPHIDTAHSSLRCGASP